MKSRLIVTAFIEKDGNVLLGRKPKDKGPYPNTWHFPGGGVDLDKETLEEGIKREIREETGLEVETLEKLGFDEDYEPNKHGELTHYVFLIYKVTPTSMNAEPADDLEKLQWFPRGELKDLELTRPSAKYFKEKGLI